MTNIRAALRWGRRRKRLRPFLLRQMNLDDADGGVARRLKLAKLLTKESVEYIRHLKEELT